MFSEDVDSAKITLVVIPVSAVVPSATNKVVTTLETPTLKLPSKDLKESLLIPEITTVWLLRSPCPSDVTPVTVLPV